ncbi:MAG TPA: NAD(P)-dependent oxidoreductase [Rhizomicrobium sp.]
MQLLVTGPGGFIGRSLGPFLNRYEVHLADRSDPGWPGKATFHTVDLLRQGGAKDLIERVKPDCLLHLAWYADAGKFWHAPQNLNWLTSSLELFTAFAENGGKRMVVAGTCAEYDWSYNPAVETTPCNPKTLYGKTKAALFSRLQTLSEQSGVEFAWGRIFFPYGPHEQYGRLVPDVITGLLMNKPVSCSSGWQIRDFMHVEDVARAFSVVLKSDLRGPINIASGEGHTVREVATILAEIIGHPERLAFGDRALQPGEPPALVADTALLQSLGFRPRFALRQGLEDAVQWWRAVVSTSNG